MVKSETFRQCIEWGNIKLFRNKGDMGCCFGLIGHTSVFLEEEYINLRHLHNKDKRQKSLYQKVQHQQYLYQHVREYKMFSLTNL